MFRVQPRSPTSEPEHVDEGRPELPAADEIEDELDRIVAVVQHADDGEPEVTDRQFFVGVQLE